MNIEHIQQYLAEHRIDGWLLADFHGRNTVATELLEISGMITRRSFYWIPAESEPIAFVHAIEQDKFAHLPGRKIVFSGYADLETNLRRILERVDKVAMEYASKGRLPYIGLVDAGTIELVRSMGVDVISSKDLVAHFQAALSVEQIALHRMAAGNVMEIKDKAFTYIRDRLEHDEPVSEFDIVTYMLQRFEEYDMETALPPICAVNANAGNPHYEPTSAKSSEIGKGDLILVDLWAKLKRPQAIYGDITWMGFAGTTGQLPQKYRDMFQILTNARDAAVAFIRDNVERKPVLGAQVDDVCRQMIDKAGYGEYFVHRTGHSITTREHGSGPNIDNLETEDDRKLSRGHLFSIEPGIYMADCGLRTEINVLIGHEGAEITTLPLQKQIVALYQ